MNSDVCMWHQRPCLSLAAAYHTLGLFYRMPPINICLQRPAAPNCVILGNHVKSALSILTCRCVFPRDTRFEMPPQLVYGILLSIPRPRALHNHGIAAPIQVSHFILTLYPAAKQIWDMKEPDFMLLYKYAVRVCLQIDTAIFPHNGAAYRPS
ncbi:uncharacterized protein BDZ99DRAFT_183359 [Mytilinidion resinicola]|uniref:Uncharacterized protein n=1 Tax=Mytilinidion resinicola TaxID=574789 RepID=A0A6A6Z0T1_9PEZI|nr:uncharacterized protein BDZ99DRAFT_183359 [Mytilinidion resinicola]KAF2814701.1 hypothetical protein BDZ99DRAFT_183359 [Mytilinidion resinicola]